VGAAPVAHLDRKLITMRVVVAVDATLCPDVQVVTGSLTLVTAGTADRLMLAGQRELGATVLLHGEQCRPKPVLIMAAPAIGGSEAAPMDVAMTVRAVLKLQAPVSPLQRQLGRMAALALDTLVRAHQRKRGLRMRAQPDLSWQPHPANAGVAVFTSISELRFVYLRMAGNAF
jgi:hypothetical protein